MSNGIDDLRGLLHAIATKDAKESESGGTPTPKCAEGCGEWRWCSEACMQARRPLNPIGTPTPKCGTCGTELARFTETMGYDGPPRYWCPKYSCPNLPMPEPLGGRGTPTGRTPAPRTTPLQVCRCGHSNWEHKSTGECAFCQCPSFIDERQPTPGSTTGGDGQWQHDALLVFLRRWNQFTMADHVEAVWADLAAARQATGAVQEQLWQSQADLAAALKREDSAIADRMRVENERDAALKREAAHDAEMDVHIQAGQEALKLTNDELQAALKQRDEARLDLIAEIKARDDYKRAWQRDLEKGREFLAERDQALKREGEAREWCSATTTALLESQERLAKEAREARERAIEECARAAHHTACEIPTTPTSACEHAMCLQYRAAAARIRALAPVPTAPPKETGQ